MWISTEKSLGLVSVGSKHTIEFQFEGELKINKNYFGKQDIILSCGCTSARWNPKTSKIEVEFVAPKIPKHLEDLNVKELAVKKTINVGYIVDDKVVRQVLTLTAIVKN